MGEGKGRGDSDEGSEEGVEYEEIQGYYTR